MTTVYTKYFHHALTRSKQEMTMQRSIVVLSAVLATVAFAPRSSAQEPSRMSVAMTIPKPTAIDTTEAVLMPKIALPESATIDTVKKIAAAKKPSSFLTTAPGIEMQNYRPEDKRGINVFEAPKDESVAYEGFKLQWGAAFTQQF
jgi:hypothetical protein